MVFASFRLASKSQVLVTASGGRSPEPILSDTISAMMKNPKHALISASTGFALLAVAMGAAAVGALAVGAVAVGAFAIGKLGIRQGRIEKLEIGDLIVDRLTIRERTSVENS
jgi:hypothetical protein